MKFGDLEKLDSIVVTVGHNEFRALSAIQLKKLARSERPVLADIKALYPREALVEAGFTVFRL